MLYMYNGLLCICSRCGLRLIILALLTFISSSGVALAAGPNLAPSLPSTGKDNEPVFIEANSMYHDRNTDTVMANGKVEIVQGARVLHAQEVRYHRPSGTVFASGNVAILEPDGNVYFADSVELKDKLKSGVVENLRARLADKSLFAAARATKVDENKTIMERAVYSPCKICDEEGNPETPLWQIKASEMTVDQLDQKISYENARFEVLGMPVIYTPYLSHPTPNADNKSGFLTPSYSISSTLGTTVHVPYFVSLAPNMDFTLAPMFTSLEGPVMIGEYRHLIESGDYAFKGSITNPDSLDSNGNPEGGKKLRWHGEGRGEFDINDDWDWGFTARRASDDTYLRRYGFSYETTLISRAYLEGFDDRKSGRRYISAEALSFQGLLSTDDPDTTPLILPLLEAEDEINLGFMGSRLKFGGNMLSLSRNEGSSTHRASATAEWLLPYTTDGGHVFDVSARMRGDAYYVENTPVSGNSSNDTVARLLPEASVGWRYPMVRFGDGNKMVFEPIVKAISAPNGGNPSEIPNEDSLSTELADSNVFDSNRFAGLDRIETGNRINYGFRTGVEFQNRMAVNLLLGQNYNLDANNDLLSDGNNLSDYVGRIEFSNPWLYAAYRFMIDQETGETISNEITAISTFSRLTFTANYINMSSDSVLGSREEALASGTLKLTDNWSLLSGGRRNLLTNAWVSTSVGLIYNNECITILTRAQRDYTTNRDIEPNTSYLVQLMLKNLN